MRYRPEIDGLRAIAVIPVILFHAGFVFFNGGFVGVDVFFVISGYLITSILIADLDANSFSIVKFYERRARRILPALFFVMFVSLPFAWGLLFPDAMKSFSDSLIGVSLFCSNFQFLSESDYFAATSELKPLIHTWSLAVEEQFYLVFPALLFATWNFGKKWVLIILALIFIISLAAAQRGVYAHPEFTYFMLPTRAWELVIGSLTAFYYNERNINHQNYWGAQFGSFLGLSLILFSILFYDKETPFPSFYALVPTLGSALVIVFTTRDAWVGKLIGNRIFAGIGLISYSAYLWHQPIFAFVKQRNFPWFGKNLMMVLVIIVFGMAYITWRYIERPFRNGRQFTRKQVFVFSLVCTAFFIFVGVIGHKTRGFLFRYPNQYELFSYEKYDVRPIYRTRSCFLNSDQTFADFQNECEREGRVEGVLIWGDSHAAALSYGLRTVIPDAIQYTASGCPPLNGVAVIDRKNCVGINDFVIKRIKHLKPKVILLDANWIRYKTVDIGVGIRTTISTIRQYSPLSKIIVVGSMPRWRPSLPVSLSAEKLYLDNIHYIKNGELDELKSIDNALHKSALKEDVIFFSPINNLCKDEFCLVTVELDGKFMPIVWDDAHLTTGGSVYLAKQLIDFVSK